MITIREACLEDVENLQNLNDDAFSSNPEFDKDLVLDWAQSDLGKTYFTSTINSAKAVIFVAEEDGKLVGYIGASDKPINYRISKYIEIDNLGIAKAYRRKGIATMLMNKLFMWAQERGYERVYLSCYFKNAEAIKFYRQAGFSEISVSFEKDL